ncbi:hypothetical protein TNCV_1340621 [Trichonephila clavipes]|nr:hypothetical protein TNCV_1340621 [Trichonephila clavipes]
MRTTWKEEELGYVIVKNSYSGKPSDKAGYEYNEVLSDESRFCVQYSDFHLRIERFQEDRSSSACIQYQHMDLVPVHGLQICHPLETYGLGLMSDLAQHPSPASMVSKKHGMEFKQKMMSCPFLSSKPRSTLCLLCFTGLGRFSCQELQLFLLILHP